MPFPVNNDTGGAAKDNTDTFVKRRDANALKEHLLNITTAHHAGMALKRGKPNLAEEGNVEIKNGYGVPGGGAYFGSPRTEIHRETEQKPTSKEVPEYLKKKLRA